MDLITLRAAVEAAFAARSGSTPPWPAPHPEREPLEEEYSRCLDPYKYRITHTRADAWLGALVELELATAHEVPTTGLWRDDPNHDDRELPDRVVVLEPTKADALALLLVYRDVRDDICASVDVGAGYPAVSTGGSPACGCDACDDGSTEVLQYIDEAVECVVAGDWIHVRGPGVEASGTPNAYGASGEDLSGVDVPALLTEARAGRSPHEVTRTIRWW